MLHGLVNRILGRSTRSGANFSPFDVDPYPLSGVNIYDLVHREEGHRQTRQLDQDLAELEPVTADSDYQPESDPDYDFIPFEYIDLELNLDMSSSLDVPPASPRPHPPQKTRATPSAAKTVLPLIRARRNVPRPRKPVVPQPPKRPPPPQLPPSSTSSPTPRALGTIRMRRPAPPSASPPPPSSTSSPAPPVLGTIRVRRPAPSSAEPSSSSSAQPRTAKQMRKSAYHKVARRKQREAEQLLLPHPAKKVVQRRVQQATPIFASLDVGADLHTTSTVWLGLRVRKPDLRAYSLEELRQLGFAYLAWDGRRVTLSRLNLYPSDRLPSVCRPLLDAQRRVFACLAGRPRPQSGGDTYSVVIQQATDAFEQAAGLASGDGRRGTFVAVSAGVSYGGGQQRPGVLLNSPANAAICATLIGNWAVQRIAQFSNSMFRAFAPDLHAFYTQQMRTLFTAAPYLRRLFPEFVSVFAACTFNLGPSTVTFPHIDAANLAWGWCCITALGNFNPDLGGHLILWDLKLVIRFPPGSTILIPSALLRHSNIAIQQGETRYSFTQFSAGGLFRWVNNGNCSDHAFYAKASNADLDQREAERAHRWENSVHMFKIWGA